MIVPMDMSTPESRKVAQRLYEKNVELENKRHKAAQARIPSDINAWHQMRENYEAIILEDHAFSEQQNIEYALWQLHYKRIEEFRAHFSAALASGSSAFQNAKGPSEFDRITKIRLQFKSFLSEATGFYHDLILKIKSKYELPLGSESQPFLEKDSKKHADVKKGLVSCHQCLIYLGDIARYKGMYGDSESKIRDFAAASSYYLEASSIWPSSGNPHHQLAILASYSGDELVTVYRCFRSLAIECPFLTAKDNLAVAFEKNRQAYAQLPGNPNPAASDVPEAYKSFRVQFARLNGIIFTRASLETFADVLMCVRGSLKFLLSSGSEEKLNFGKDAMENGLIIVRLVAILIFSAHNAKREIDGPTYAEILQREVLIEKAFTAIFDFVGHIMSRCKELQDVSSSCLLPGILVFVEWLASCSDVVSDTDVKDKHAEVRFTFWNDFVTFLNKILSDGLVSTDDEDATCFFNMSTYEESENENRFALWEDFELRGFLPLTPAQNILDFSRKHSSGSNKEKKARVQRIFAAGKVLANIIKVGQKSICFDSTMKRFTAGVESPLSGDKPKLSNQNALHHVAMEKVVAKGMLQPNGQLFSEVEGDEEDEVIVFKPTVTDKVNNAVDPSSAPVGREVHETYAVGGVSLSSSGYIPVSQPYSHNHGQVEFQTVVQPPISYQISGNVPQYHEPIQSLSCSEQLTNGLTGLGFMENGPRIDARRQADVGMSYPLPSRLHQVADSNTNRAVYGQSNAPESFIPLSVGTTVSSGPRADAFSVKTAVPFPEGSRKNPISRPHRHLGPPPGFNSVPRKQMSDSISVQSSETKSIDEYSWLNGHRIPVPMSMSSTGLNNVPMQVNSQANDVNGNMFPFSGKQVSRLQSHLQQNRTSFEHMDQKVVQYQYQQQLAQAQLQNQPHGISKWPGQNLV